jgi:hypothetical protein
MNGLPKETFDTTVTAGFQVRAGILTFIDNRTGRNPAEHDYQNYRQITTAW